MSTGSKAFQIHTIEADRAQLLINQEKMPGAILHQCVAHTKLFTWGVLGMLLKQPRGTLLTFHNGKWMLMSHIGMNLMWCL